MSFESKYDKIYNYILDKIGRGEYSDGKIESENELCTLFNVSRPTVRQAIAKLESGGYVQRIKGSGVYTSLLKYRSIKGHKKRNLKKKIGFILPNITNRVFYDVFSEIETRLTQEDYKIILRTTNYSITAEEEAMQSISDENVDAIVMTASNSALPWANADLYKEITSSGVPFIFLNDSYFPDVISTDAIEIADKLTSVLVKNAHSKIICLLEANSVKSHAFYKGIIDHLMKYNVNLRNIKFCWYSPENPEDEINQINFHNYTACIAQNDQIAILVVEKTKSFPIPQRFSVVCLESTNNSSPLTCGVYPVKEASDSVIALIHSLTESNKFISQKPIPYYFNRGNTVDFSSKHNPFIAGDWADPYILADGDNYYLYPTTNWQSPKIYAFESKDLFHFKNPIEVFNSTSSGLNGAAWAPSVIHYKDLYYMVYCNENSLIFCYSDSPLGPFHYTSDVEINYNPLPFDPHMFIDDGNIYLVCGLVVCSLIPLEIDGYSIRQSGKSVPLTTYITGSDDIHKPESLKFNGGARLTKVKDKYLLTWFCYNTIDPRCQVRYAWGDKISGPYIPTQDNILIKGNNVIKGVSHAQIVQKDDEFYVFYNRLNTNAVKQERELCFERIQITDDGKIIAFPT